MKIEEALEFLFEMDVKTGQEVICVNGHHFHANKYDECPICGSELRVMTLEDIGKGQGDEPRESEEA